MGYLYLIWDVLCYNGQSYLTAVHTDVIEFDKEINIIKGLLYGVRIIYGPYEYVVEEF